MKQPKEPVVLTLTGDTTLNDEQTRQLNEGKLRIHTNGWMLVTSPNVPLDLPRWHSSPFQTRSVDPKTRRITNQRRELRRLNRLLQTLRGLYREAARSSLERVCVELGKERDAARKECERLQAILDGPEGRIRQESEVVVSSQTGSVADSYFLSPGGIGGCGSGRLEFRCGKCGALLCQKPISERLGTFPHDYYCPNCNLRVAKTAVQDKPGRAPDGADATDTTPARGGKGEKK